MIEETKPIQKILFGGPGTGKSYHIRKIATEQLGIAFDEQRKMLENTIQTVFHPEYTYADFMGKLLPLTQASSVIYKFYPGHFLRSIGMAYRGLIDGNNMNYLLAIDELNRGNASAIFGTIFQLLDREEDGWSSYEVDISEMELVGLLNAMRYEPSVQSSGSIMVGSPEERLERFCDDLDNLLKNNNNQDGLRVINLLRNNKISIPCNLSIVATINTSDESIYYLDSAFKRRWDWQYFETPEVGNGSMYVPYPISIQTLELEERKLSWPRCIVGLNEFIKSNYKTVKRIEDKQIGWWFVKPESGKISLAKIEDKLMFYLWDNVFSRDKKPLELMLSKATNDEIKLVTFADFIRETEFLIIYLHDSILELDIDDEPF